VNYYEHHIGDYRKDTSHLSLLEHGIYRQLIDTYYTDEKPLTLDHAKLMRSHSVRSADEVQAFQNVLSDFFIRTEEGYVHKRCEAVIEAYRAKSVKASESAKARWSKGKSEGSADAMRSHSEGNANHKPVTSNQEPVTKEKKPRAKRVSSPDDFDPMAWMLERGVDERHAKDWLAVRKKKGGANTLTAFEAVEKEAAKAGITLADAVQMCAVRSWRGFEAEFLTNRQSALDLAKQVQQKAGSRSAGNTTQKSRFDLKSTQYDGPTDAPFDF
jgi:uncharacterized protein YdaU (DUF1376 family)